MNENVKAYYDAIIEAWPPEAGDRSPIVFEVVSILYAAGELPQDPEARWIDYFKDCVSEIYWYTYMSTILLGYALYKCKQYADQQVAMEE